MALFYFSKRSGNLDLYDVGSWEDITMENTQQFRQILAKNTYHILMDYPSNISQKKGILKIKNKTTLAAPCNQ
jgi:hypothetical protein